MMFNNKSILLSVFIILFACSGNSGISQAELDEFGKRIEKASDLQITYISEGLDPGNYIKTAYTVKSNYHVNAYFLAAKIYGPGMGDGEVGIWFTTGTKDTPGIIQSVNGIAQMFTPYPKGSSTKSGASMLMKDPQLLDIYCDKMP